MIHLFYATRISLHKMMPSITIRYTCLCFVLNDLYKLAMHLLVYELTINHFNIFKDKEMKEICTSQYKKVSGGNFGGQCGRGSSSSNCGGGNGGRELKVTKMKGRPGSGIMAENFFGSGGNGPAGGCTGGSRARELGGKNH